MQITGHIRIGTPGVTIGEQHPHLIIPDLAIVSTDAGKLRRLHTGPITNPYRVNPLPSYRPYYKPGYRVNPLPYGHNRIFVNSTEYFFSNGYFYQPSRTGYVIVEAPIGAIVLALPRLHQFVYWRGQPYYTVGNTYYRRHPRGYIVVPNPGYSRGRCCLSNPIENK